jgi:hypothetical protein
MTCILQYTWYSLLQQLQLIYTIGTPPSTLLTRKLTSWSKSIGLRFNWTGSMELILNFYGAYQLWLKYWDRIYWVLLKTWSDRFLCIRAPVFWTYYLGPQA